VRRRCREWIWHAMMGKGKAARPKGWGARAPGAVAP
jgi:hypothetical protein